ncbi:hypothetical protein J2D73_00245 [Acetobacter sacchari]|uniref:Uncharacterized protein n=1 Tax=Acetobacter sacchari TaxID=2661687 RepID=A0ABS3LQP5_9PROT|nr:hypothetical protein [Acetobacter sacchari]MBO1358227.1 hypothetical protein [Acetobacter sacchari]
MIGWTPDGWALSRGTDYTTRPLAVSSRPLPSGLDAGEWAPGGLGSPISIIRLDGLR